MTTKRCTKCGDEKPVSLFNRAFRESDGLQDWCKSCKSEASSAALARRREIHGAESVRRPLASSVDGDSAWCGSCKRMLPLFHFGKRIGRCKECACRQSKISREAMMEAESKLPPTHPKACGCCKEIKTLADFQKGQRRCRECQNAKVSEHDAANPDLKKLRTSKHYQANKSKRAEARKRHRAENPDWWRKWERRYNKTEKGNAVRRSVTHKRRSATRAGTVTSDQMVEIKKNAKGRCHYCGCKTSRLTFDHIIPLAKGGTHSADNLVMACGPCNSSKSDRDPIEFAKTRGLLLV